MSERLRKAYLKREEKRIEKLVKLKSKDLLARQHAAGEVFKKKYGCLLMGRSRGNDVLVMKLGY